jgi:hypothetical protein
VRELNRKGREERKGDLTTEGTEGAGDLTTKDTKEHKGVAWMILSRISTGFMTWSNGQQEKWIFVFFFVFLRVLCG